MTVTLIRPACEHCGALTSRVVRTGSLVVDLDARTATVGGGEIHLTPREWELLAYLAEHVGQWRTAHEVRAAIWGEAQAWTVPQIVASNRGRLAGKLGAAGALIEVRLSGPTPGGSQMRLASVEVGP